MNCEAAAEKSYANKNLNKQIKERPKYFHLFSRAVYYAEVELSAPFDAAKIGRLL